jgi:rfaE bifunctional protein kinase chain/domain
MKSDFNNQIKKKIINLVELKKKIKKKTFSLCHGAFDIVHPGHLRQFVYAKKFAPILVVSLTSDEFISKDKLRPYVNEELRSLNLASYEIVDYVLIDRNPEPYKLLKKLKPNFFVKGFEYQNLQNQKTKIEKKILDDLNCKFLFSPGDVIFSSSAFIKSIKPNIKYEKLFTLLKSESLKILDLKNIIKKFSNLKISILGDTIVDKYSKSNVIGGMHKSPTISVKILKEENFVGGAAIIAMHLASTGAKINFSTIIGKDAASNFVIRSFKKFKNIKTNFLLKNDRPTTLKNNIIVGNHKLLKIDTVENSPINSSDINYLCDKKFLNCDGVILSDFRHGIFNKDNINQIFKLIKKIKFKVADTQVASRWGNLTEFKNFDLLTPNEKEVRFALADQDTVLRPLGKILMDKTNCKNLFITLGPDGVISIRGKKYKRSSFHLDSFAENIIDPVGAGDAFLSYSALSMLVSKNDVASTIIGSIASKISCETFGNLPISKNVVLNNLDKLEKIENTIF